MDYRLYFLDEAGRIRKAEDLRCQNDAAAIDLVAARFGGRAMELWQAARRIHTFAGAEQDPQAAAG